MGCPIASRHPPLAFHVVQCASQVFQSISRLPPESQGELKLCVHAARANTINAPMLQPQQLHRV